MKKKILLSALLPLLMAMPLILPAQPIVTNTLDINNVKAYATTAGLLFNVSSTN